MNAFNWRDAPSDLIKQIQPTRKARAVNLQPKRMHTYAVATPADAALEAQIAQTNREVEHHFACAQSVTDDVMRGFHRDEVRRLASKVRDLVASRSAAQVARMEDCYFAEQGDAARRQANA